MAINYKSEKYRIYRRAYHRLKRLERGPLEPKFYNCQVCGKYFQGTNMPQKFCSRYCYYRSTKYMERNAKYRKNKRLKKTLSGFCLLCEKQFFTTPGNLAKKFCNRNCRHKFAKKKISVMNIELIKLFNKDTPTLRERRLAYKNLYPDKYKINKRLYRYRAKWGFNKEGGLRYMALVDMEFECQKAKKTVSQLPMERDHS